MVSVELFQLIIRLKIIFNKKIFALLNFVYYIINTFHVKDISKIDGDSMPFVLLVVGLFIGIFGIIGLFLLKGQIYRVITVEAEKEKASTDNTSLM